MSEDNKPAIIDERTHDFSDRDMEKINKFTEAGLPGIAEISQETLGRMLDLYMSGKPYRMIGAVTKVPMPVILYMSHKFNWFLRRQEYLEDLEKSMRSRLAESKVVSQDFLLTVMGALEKKISKQVQTYMSSEDPSHADAIDIKAVEKYMKMAEFLRTINAPIKPVGDDAPPPPSPIGLNLGEHGVTIEKQGDGSVSITPKQKAISEALKEMADSRREEEKVPTKKT